MIKKLLLIPLSLLLAISLIAIGCPTTPSETTTPTTTTPTTPTTPTTTPPEQEVYKWDMTYALYSGTWDWDILVRWCDDLRVASGGRLDITPYGGGEIMPVLETWDALSTGTLKIDFGYAPYWLGKLPMSIFASGIPPFTLPNWTDYHVFYYNYGIEDLIRQAYAEHNIYYVAPMPTDDVVTLSRFPINKAADFKGQTLRATGIYAEVLTKAGASCPYFPWGEIYGALEKGTIDGVCCGGCLGCLCDAGFHECCQYFLETPVSPSDAWSLQVNLDAWNSLPPDLQKLLYESAWYAEDIFTASYFWHGYDWERRLVDEYDYTVTTLPLEDQAIMRGYSMEVLEKYAAEDPVYFAPAFEALKEYMRLRGLL